MPGIPSSEKEQLEKSLRYNLWASLIRFIVLNFVLTCVWFFGFGLGFDAIKAATGQQLKGTMTVTGVVQEDGLTLSVKDPNKGKHVVYSLTDLGVDPTGWSYGGRLNTYKIVEITVSSQLYRRKKPLVYKDWKTQFL